MSNKDIEKIYFLDFFTQPLKRQIEQFGEITGGKVKLVPYDKYTLEDVYKSERVPKDPYYFSFTVLTGDENIIGYLELFVSKKLKHFDYDQHFKDYRTSRKLVYHRFDLFGVDTIGPHRHQWEVYYTHKDVEELLLLLYGNQFKEQLETYINEKLESENVTVEETPVTTEGYGNCFSDLTLEKQVEKVKEFFGKTVQCRLSRLFSYGVPSGYYDDPRKAEREFHFEICSPEKGRIAFLEVNFDFDLKYFDYDKYFKDEKYAFLDNVYHTLDILEKKEDEFKNENSFVSDDIYFEEDLKEAFYKAYDSEFKEQLETLLNQIIEKYILNYTNQSDYFEYILELFQRYKKGDKKESFAEYVRYYLESKKHNALTNFKYLEFLLEDPYFDEYYEDLYNGVFDGILNWREEQKKRVESKPEILYDENGNKIIDLPF